MQIVQDFEIKPANELVPGELFAVREGRGSALAIELVRPGGDPRNFVLALATVDETMRIPQFTSMRLDSAMVASFGTEWLLRPVYRTGQPIAIDYNSAVGSLILGKGMANMIAGIDRQHTRSVQFIDLTKFETTSQLRADGIQLSSWEIWLKAQDVDRPGAAPVFSFSAPGSTA